MKKNYIILLVAILFSGLTIAQETQKNFINYQGVARNGADQLMANESMTIGIALKTGSATGAATYAENHSVTTDANGVFSLKIGNGDVVSGDYNSIPWGNEATFVSVLVNGSEIGTTEMMAVPYALSSGDGSQSASEVPYDNTVSGLAANNAQEAIDELVGSGAVDADADPANEFQTLSFDAVTNELSLTDGNSVVIPSGGTDADADPTNELQDISLSGTDLSISDGSTLDLSAIIPPGGTDDQSAAEVPFDNAISGLAATDTQAAIEELAGGGLVDTDDQDLSLSGTLLQISDGTGVDLAPIIPPGGTDDQNAGEVPYDNTASGLAATDSQAAIDELATSGLVDTDDQDLSLSGTTLQITDGASVDLAPIIPAGGTDDQNAGEVPFDNTASGLAATDTQAAIDELAASGVVDTDDQNLTFDDAANTLEIENGNTVDLSSLAGGGGSSLWEENGDGVYRNTGSVGIGTTPHIQNMLRISTSDEAIRNGIYSRITHSGYKVAISARAEGNGNSNTFGNRSNARGESTGRAWAYRGDIGGAGTGTKYGLDLIFYDGTAGTKYGIYTKGEDRNYFSGAVGIGTDSPDEELVVGENIGNNWLVPAVTVGDSNGGAFQVGNRNVNLKIDVGTVSGRTRFRTFDSNGDGQGIIEMSTRQLNVGRSPGVNTMQTYPLRVVQNIPGQGGQFGINLINGVNSEENWELYVATTSAADGDLVLYHDGNIRGRFSSTTGAYSPTSDARLKTNIKNTKGLLEKLLELKPKRYNYKSNKGQIYHGFLAQDLQTVFPETVDEVNGKNGGGSTFLVDYNQLVSISVGAIQEQQATIMAQTEKINDLEQRLARLEARLNN